MAAPTFPKLNIFSQIKSESRRSSGDAREKCESTATRGLGSCIVRWPCGLLWTCGGYGLHVDYVWVVVDVWWLWAACGLCSLHMGYIWMMGLIVMQMRSGW